VLDSKMTLDEAIEAWDRDAYRAGRGLDATRQRDAIIAAFPETAWPELPLDRYAIGAGEDRSFSWYLEFFATDLGSIRGGYSQKFLIFRKADDDRWIYPGGYPTVEDAWRAIRSDLVAAFAAARAGELDVLHDLPSLQNGSGAIAKAISIYAPDALFPAFSARHRAHWQSILGVVSDAETAWEVCRALRDHVRADSRFDGWSLNEVMRMLYDWRPPEREAAATIGASGTAATPTGGDPSLPDPRWPELAEAMDRRGQVILYGPPGTGKTWHARRFATWFLHGRPAGPDAMIQFASEAAFRTAEERLVSPRAERRTWWMVANPTLWGWERLARDGSVDFEVGKVNAHFAAVQPGDLVIGYQSRPDSRVVALAMVRSGLRPTGEGERITLEPLRMVTNGPTWHELQADALLAASEPVRHRNQGTLFALTPHEAAHVLALLRARDPLIGQVESTGSSDIGPLTRVTFHPSYTYEDFVEGYRPIPSTDGKLNLALEPGIFRRVCDAARADPEQPYVLLIDEINRGNVSKILGELITLIERDKRGLTVRLPQSRDEFSVPPNLYLLGTMNTADRSIRLLDTALRRRFAFVELMPEPSVLAGKAIGHLDLARFLEALNERITRKRGRERQVGHAFLLAEGKPVRDASELAARIRHELIPLLQEYAYDDYGELATYLGDRIVDVDRQAIRSAVVNDVSALLDALTAEYMDDVEPSGDRGT